jgi:hypothetical protein
MFLHILNLPRAPHAKACMALLVMASTASAFAQGSLTPPAAPTPTMKTLDQIEPRVPIDATHTPGDSLREFVIAQPGSYYLAANLNVSRPTAFASQLPG